MLYITIFYFSFKIACLEPGYYQDDEFGIRIEDIVQVVPANVNFDFGGRGALSFYTVTMCPIQTKLIDPNLLDDIEVIIYKLIILTTF